MKRLKYLMAFASVFLLLTGCGDKQEDTPKKEEVVDENAVDKTDTAKKDEDLAEEMEKNKSISEVNIIVTEDGGGFVLADFEVENEIEEAAAQKLADEQAKLLKEKYPDYNIDVQARKGGEKFVQATIEKE